MTKGDMILQLRPAQRKRLSVLTQRIQANLAALLDLSRPTLAIAADLRAIHAERLYVEHGTFAAFCRAHFGFTRNRGYQLLEAAGVVEDLRGADAPPRTEGQTRPLSGLSAKDRRAVWSKAIEEHGLQPTAAEVRATLDKLAAQDRLQSVREQEQAARQRTPTTYDPAKARAWACAIVLVAVGKIRHAASMARRAGADDQAEQFEAAADLLSRAAA